eukprot:gnl/TRDRNA2_/TRDRNA2_86531_c0_seq1.p1 gnl/TRDRNA2_/TRDRNA2_86531_c0~~gnl/TRDRNA2_/TRDRNA2_86531_c0_seq1.p1  ORF type:complete len:574 (-),score=54.57 gnl/TRDRNA2_/TRDRNA2_86531_c0_seq1:18-1700(-)
MRAAHRCCMLSAFYVATARADAAELIVGSQRALAVAWRAIFGNLTAVIHGHHGFPGWPLFLLAILFVLYCAGVTCSRHLVKYVVDPRRGSHKYILLFFICLFIPGPYFHDAIVQCYKGPISDAMQLSNTQFASLYAVSSATGILCAPAGAAILYLGRTRFAMLASSFTVVGSTMVTLGFHWDTLNVMLAGRFVFWLALNALLMVQTILVFDLFKGKELNFAMTVIVCSIRFGGSLSYPLSGPLLHRAGVLDSLWFSVFLVCIGFLSTLIFAYLFRGTATARAMRRIMENKKTKKTFDLRLVRHIPRSVPFFLCSLGAVWGVVFPFEVIGDDMLQHEFGYNANDAGFIIAIAPMVSILSPIMAPFLGTTRRSKLMACFSGLALLTIAFGVLALRQPIMGILIVGIGYAISVCSFYSTIPMLVASGVPAPLRKNVESLVVGINMAGSGITMIVSNLAIGYIKDHASYFWAFIYLMSMALWGALNVVIAAWMHKPMPVDQDSQVEELDDDLKAQGDEDGSTVVLPGVDSEACSRESSADGAGALCLSIEDTYYNRGDFRTASQ